MEPILHICLKAIMKKLNLVILSVCLGCYCLGQNPVTVQASPSNLNVPANAQPVPNSNTVEKGAPTPKPLIAPPANPVPPIYPGAEAKTVETQANLIFPASPPAPTQPVQKEPLSPVETTNNLQPNRPFRDEQSRTVQPVNIEYKPANAVTVLKEQQPIKKPVTTKKTYTPVIKTTEMKKPVKSDVTPSVSSRETIAMKVDGSANNRRDTVNQKQNNSAKPRKY
jgi:hypothetical protein